MERSCPTTSNCEVTTILCILSRANVALGYTLCRYDGSGGEERANTKISGSCGIDKLGLVVSIKGGDAVSTYQQTLNRS